MTRVQCYAGPEISVTRHYVIKLLPAALFTCVTVPVRLYVLRGGVGRRVTCLIKDCAVPETSVTR